MGRKIGRTGERYITYTNNKYRVQKRVNGRQLDYGGFNSLHEAIVHRTYCHINEWDLRCKANLKDPSMKYIREVHNSYQILKQLEGKTYNFGSFKKLEDALWHREYCIKHDWDMSCKYVQNKKHNLPHYISYARDGRYYIQKKVDDEVRTWHGFKSLDDAVHERDVLIRCDWDEERLMELDECEGTL